MCSERFACELLNPRVVSFVDDARDGVATEEGRSHGEKPCDHSETQTSHEVLLHLQLKHAMMISIEGAALALLKAPSREFGGHVINAPADSISGFE